MNFVKKMFLAGLTLIGLASTANAAVLTAEQVAAVTDSVTSGIGEYVAFILALIVITYPATLIIRSLRNVGKGKSS